MTTVIRPKTESRLQRPIHNDSLEKIPNPRSVLQKRTRLSLKPKSPNPRGRVPTTQQTRRTICQKTSGPTTAKPRHISAGIPPPTRPCLHRPISDTTTKPATTPNPIAVITKLIGRSSAATELVPIPPSTDVISHLTTTELTGRPPNHDRGTPLTTRPPPIA